MHNANWLNKVPYRETEIVCPVCGCVQKAIVYETIPFELYAHECKKCGYLILESEWHENK